jgi:hypothetical protein
MQSVVQINCKCGGRYFCEKCADNFMGWYANFKNKNAVIFLKYLCKFRPNEQIKRVLMEYFNYANIRSKNSLVDVINEYLYFHSIKLFRWFINNSNYNYWFRNDVGLKYDSFEWIFRQFKYVNRWNLDQYMGGSEYIKYYYYLWHRFKILEKKNRNELYIKNNKIVCIMIRRRRIKKVIHAWVFEI